MTNAWDPLLAHDDDAGAHIAGQPTNFAKLTAPELYLLLTKINGDAMTGATTYWGNAADYLGGPAGTPGGLIQALTGLLKPLTDGAWVGSAADQFHQATDRLVAFAKQLCETIRYLETVHSGGAAPYPGAMPATVYASFHSISDRLGDWMGFVATELPASPLTNGGNSWTDPSVDQSKIDQFDFSRANGEWIRFAQHNEPLTLPTFRTYYAGRGGAARAPAGDKTDTADGWTDFLNNTSPNHPYVADPDALRGFIYKIRKRFLDSQQLAFFQLMANETASCYRYYYPYIPHPPTWKGFSSDSSQGGGGGATMPPFDPASLGGLSGMDIPSGPTGTGLTDPGPLPDGSIITDPNGPTSLAGFDPTAFGPGGLMTPLGGLSGLGGSGGLSGYGGGLSSGLDGLGVGAGGLDPSGLDPLPDPAAALEASAARPAGMGMYPPMMGGAGAQNQDQERPRAPYLVEDEQFWAVDPDRPPSVIGGGE